MSYGAPPAPVQPPVGPVRSRGGLVDVTVTPSDLVLTLHSSWRDWFDGDFVGGLVAVVGVVVGLAGAAVGGPVGLVLIVVGVLLVLPVVVVYVVTWAAIVFFAVQALVRLTTRSGRARMRRGAVQFFSAFDDPGRSTLPRAAIVGVSAVEVGWRARLRVATRDGEVVLSTPRRHRGRLEAVGWALYAR